MARTEVEPRTRRSLAARIARALVVGVVVAVGVLVWVTVQPMPFGPRARSTRARDATRTTEDATVLRRDVEVLVTFAPRDASKPERLREVAEHLRDRIRGDGGLASLQTFEIEGQTYANVVARYGPDAMRRIVIGAHYDAFGPHPGADDNASGVAGLLLLAARLAKDPPARQVELVAYTLEEPPRYATPHMGSVHHANALVDAGVRIDAMISLEMIGYFDDRAGSQTFPFPGMGLLYPTKGNFIAVVGNLSAIGLVRDVKGAMRPATPLRVESINAPAFVPGIDFSDHRSYAARGVPAVMITDTAFYRNRHYHQASDDPETLDYERMVDVIDGVEAFVRSAD